LKINKIIKSFYSPTSDGAAAIVLCSERYLIAHPHLKEQAVEIVGKYRNT
jgi:hypothetical protein